MCVRLLISKTQFRSGQHKVTAIVIDTSLGTTTETSLIQPSFGTLFITVSVQHVLLPVIVVGFMV